MPVRSPHLRAVLATTVGFTLAMTVGECIPRDDTPSLALLPFLTLYLRDQGLDIPQTASIFFGASAMLLFFPFFWGMMADRFIPLNRLFTILNLFIGIIVSTMQELHIGPDMTGGRAEIEKTLNRIETDLQSLRQSLKQPPTD